MENQQQSFGEWLMQPTESIKMEEGSDAPVRAHDFDNPGSWGTSDGREVVLVYIPSTHTLHSMLSEYWSEITRKVVRHLGGYPIEPGSFSDILDWD